MGNPKRERYMQMCLSVVCFILHSFLRSLFSSVSPQGGLKEGSVEKGATALAFSYLPRQPLKNSSCRVKSHGKNPQNKQHKSNQPQIDRQSIDPLCLGQKRSPFSLEIGLKPLTIPSLCSFVHFSIAPLHRSLLLPCLSSFLLSPLSSFPPFIDSFVHTTIYSSPSLKLLTLIVNCLSIMSSLLLLALYQYTEIKVILVQLNTTYGISGYALYNCLPTFLGVRKRECSARERLHFFSVFVLFLCKSMKWC